jgi:hypothetical protein
MILKVWDIVKLSSCVKVPAFHHKPVSKWIRYGKHGTILILLIR